MPLLTRSSTPGTVTIAAVHPRTGEEAEIILPLWNAGTFPGQVEVSNVGAFPPKQVIGDWRETSHQVLSSVTQNSFTGGGQKRESSETEDMDRYAGIATLETRFPGHLMLLPWVQEVTGPNIADPRVLGDLFHGGALHTYVAWGTALREVTGAYADYPDALALSGALTLSEAATAPAVVFSKAGELNLYIPQDGGYQTFDGTTVDAQVTTINPLWFMVHAGKLWALERDGTLVKSLDGTTWTDVLTLDPGLTPRGVIAYYDRAEVPVPHLVTDAGVYAVDEAVPQQYLTELNYAPHPYAGTAFDVWRTDLYVGIGKGIQRYTQGTVNAVGIDRDDGPDMEGYVSTMRRGFNDLFYGLTPIAVPGAVPLEEVVVDQGLEVYIGGAQSRAAVMRHTGGQVPHTLWRPTTQGGTVRDLFVSTANSDYRLLWSWNGSLWVTRLTTDFDNPAHNTESLFMPSGDLTRSWLDMNMPVDRKTLASVETRAEERFAAGCAYTIDFQVDDDDARNRWQALATVSTVGNHEFRVGENGTFPTTQTNQTRYDGIGFGRYRDRIVMSSTDRTKTPVMKSITPVFRKRMRRLRNFEFTVDCTSPELDGKYGLGNAERRALLHTLIESETFIPMIYGREWITVQFSYAQGAEGTGDDQAGGNVSVSALEAWEVTS